MKYHIIWLPVFLGFLFSCASAPPAEAPPPPAPPPPQAPAQPAPPPKAPVDFGEARARATSALEQAKSVKADVSVKAHYDAAFSAYTEAESLEAAGSGDGIKKYFDAETAFLAAYEEALAKREEARQQLSRAREAIKSVEDEAAEFERQRTETPEQGGAQ